MKTLTSPNIHQQLEIKMRRQHIAIVDTTLPHICFKIINFKNLKQTKIVETLTFNYNLHSLGRALALDGEPLPLTAASAAEPSDRQNPAQASLLCHACLLSHFRIAPDSSYTCKLQVSGLSLLPPPLRRACVRAPRCGRPMGAMTSHLRAPMDTMIPRSPRERTIGALAYHDNSASPHAPTTTAAISHC